MLKSNLLKAPKLFLVLFFIIYYNNTFSQKVKYVTHNKEGLVPYSSITKKNQPSSKILDVNVIKHSKPKSNIISNIYDNELTLKTTISGVDLINSRAIKKSDYVSYHLISYDQQKT